MLLQYFRALFFLTSQKPSIALKKPFIKMAKCGAQIYGPKWQRDLCVSSGKSKKKEKKRNRSSFSISKWLKSLTGIFAWHSLDSLAFHREKMEKLAGECGG